MFARSVAASVAEKLLSMCNPRRFVVVLVPIEVRAIDHPKVVEKAEVDSIRPKNNWLSRIVPYMTFHPTTLNWLCGSDLSALSR